MHHYHCHCKHWFHCGCNSHQPWVVWLLLLHGILKCHGVLAGMLWLFHGKWHIYQGRCAVGTGVGQNSHRLLWLPKMPSSPTTTHLPIGISSFLTPQSSGQNPAHPQPYCSIACLICQLSIIYTACRKRETHQHSFRTFFNIKYELIY